MCQLRVITVLASDACTEEVLGYRRISSLLPLKSGFYPRRHISLEPPVSLSLPLAWILSTDHPGSPYQLREVSPHVASQSLKDRPGNDRFVLGTRIAKIVHVFNN